MPEKSEGHAHQAGDDEAGPIRDDLQSSAEQMISIVDDLWPDLERIRHRWELYLYGLPDGEGKRTADDVLASLNQALRSMSGVRNSLLRAATLLIDGNSDPRNC